MLKHPRAVRVKTSKFSLFASLFFYFWPANDNVSSYICLLTDGDVELLEYEASPSGIIKSFQDRFPSESTLQVLQDLWNKEQPYFSS